MSSPMQLRSYDNRWFDPGRPLLIRMLWLLFAQPIFRSPLLPSSRLRVALLRLFGANVGQEVVIHSEVIVKYPWHLTVGDNCWIGERVWIDCLTKVTVGSNVCISQGAYLCTGNHDWSDPAFGLRVEPILLMDGSWVGAQSTLLPGSCLSVGAVVTGGAVLTGTVPELEVFSGNPARFVRARKMRTAAAPEPVAMAVAP